MSREQLIRYAGPAAIAGGALYLATFAMACLIYGVFERQAKGTFVAAHVFIHPFDTPMFALLALGAVGVYLREAGKVGFGLSVVGGLTIIFVGLAVSGEATLGILDVITHPLAHVLYAVGSLFFGIATFRANVLPRGAALLTAVGPIRCFATFMTGFGGGEAGLGED